MLNLGKKFDKLSEEATKNMRNSVESLIKEDNNKEFKLAYFFTKSYELIEETYKTNVIGDKIQAKSSVSNNKKTSKEGNKSPKKERESTITEDSNGKKKPMKTAADVVNRIQWDELINKEYITVGYLDRFVGIKECSFETFDWGDIVLADLGALAIPEHRINYFKYKDELIWDKNQRIDNVYGSTGSNTTIYDVIKRLDNVRFNQIASNDDDKPNKLGRVKPTTTTAAVASNIVSNEKEDNQPNYFISIPITNNEIKTNFQNISQIIEAKNQSAKSITVPDTSLHVTLCTLRINDENEINKVKKIIETLVKNGELNKYLPINMNFNRIDNFYDKVLHIKCDCDIEKLIKLKDTILNELERSNINIAGNYYEFIPHLTILKISNRNTNNKNASVYDYISKESLNKYQDFEFGKQTVDELHLCKMVNIFSALTYPVEFSVKLN